VCDVRYVSVQTRDIAREFPVVFVFVHFFTENIACSGCHDVKRRARTFRRVKLWASMNSMNFRYRDIAKMIDHSMLAPTFTVSEFEAGIALARQYDVASVCLVPSFVRRCAELLAVRT